jgi:apolipoprotein N-acyltransferase
MVLGNIGLAALLATFAGVAGWADGFVLAVLILVMRGAVWSLFAVGAVLLFVVAFPPLSWPTCWFCFAPLVWIWRERRLSRSLVRDVLEAVAVGFLMALLSTGFVRDAVPAWGGVLHGVACLVFSLQVVGLALAIRFLWDRAVPLAAAVTAVVAVAGEFLSAGMANGVVWSVTSISLAAADTPVAQWAALVTPFGVSGILCFVNFLFVPNQSPTWWHRWTGPIFGVVVAGAAWAGGDWLALATRVEPLPFSVMLVQPHVRVSANVPWRPWLELDSLTQASLQQAGRVDLIVWPEGCLSSSHHENSEAAVVDVATRLTVQEFAQKHQPIYRTSCLVGVPLWKRETIERYGLLVTEGRRYNCGCLVSGPDEIACHEKQALVPFKEGLPGWLDQGWIRGRILPALQWNASFTPGNEFRVLSFRDREQQARLIAVSICYESFLPWLPQYLNSQAAEAIVHLVYDGDSVEHPGLLQRQILACRYRAIETRKWNLGCSTWSGSAIIDPTGKVVAQLPTTAGVLRTNPVN